MKRSSSLWITLLISIIMFGSAENLWAMGRKPETFAIKIRVDFGPAGKPAHEGTLFIERGTTPRDAVGQVFPVLFGMACCSLREIIAIDGVKIDPAQNYWWTCHVNGSRKVSPMRYKLKKGDLLEWRYIVESQ